MHNDAGLKKPYQENLAALIHEPTFRSILPPMLFKNAVLIQKLGNQAVHSEIAINSTDALHIARALHALLGWVARIYSRTSDIVLPFDEALVPRPKAAAPDRTVEQLQQLQTELQNKDSELAAREERLKQTDLEISNLRFEIAELRKSREQTVPVEEISEAETRDRYIDVLLREAGWNPHGPNVCEYRVTGMPTVSGEGFIDYALWGKDGLPLAVVEAKRTKRSPQEGQRQAELYADCLERMTGQRPVIFYSNGYEHWIWDDRNYPPREVQGFYKQDELQLLINRRTNRDDIAKVAPNRAITDRYYQQEAIRRVTETYANDKQREALLVMATGTGKTRLSIAIVELLMKSNWARRVLFLADRNALLTQARRNFTKFLPSTSSVDLTQAKENDDCRIVFSTYPTMMNCIDNKSEDDISRFGVGHFDLNIIDEAHRSVYAKYKAIFDYFDSLLLGLTATPRSEVDRDTYHLFGLEQGVPTSAYELTQAVADEFLVNFRPIVVPTKFSREGIKYKDLSEDEQKEYEEKFFDEETGEVPDEVDAAALHRWLFNENTIDQVLAYVMEKGLKVEGGDKLGKTIIFAANHDHAAFIVKRFDKMFPHLAGKFCRLIDNTVTFAQSLIDDFSLAGKQPQIAVSVDMLDTGIDVPECVNLVFIKRVRSKTKFWQMIGRGTRLCPDLFGPGQHKDEFYLFDFCDNLPFFGENPEGIEARVAESLKTRIFRSRVTLIELLQRHPQLDDALILLRSDVADLLHSDIAQMNVDSFVVRPHRRHVERFAQRKSWNTLGAGDVVDIHQHLATLPCPDDGDEFARRFDLLLLNLQLGTLESSPSVLRWQQQVVAIAGGLEEKEAIPAVKQHITLIQEIQQPEFWEHISLPILEEVRRKLRELVRFLDREEKRGNVYTNFEDEIGEAEEGPNLLRQDDGLKNYRLKVERFVREHADHPTIARLIPRTGGIGTNPTELASVETGLCTTGAAWCKGPKTTEASSMGFVPSSSASSSPRPTAPICPWANSSARLSASIRNPRRKRSPTSSAKARCLPVR